jgi:hypothetical protein
MRLVAVMAALLMASGELPVVVGTAPATDTFQWNGHAEWIAFSLEHRNITVTVHYTATLDCGTKLACFINDLFYGEKGEFGGNGQEGGVDSTIGEQTSVQVAGHRVINTERPPIGKGQPRDATSEIDLTLSEARGNGNWTTVAILASGPANISLTIRPATSLFDFRIGQSGVKKVSAHDFSAAGDVMQSGFVVGEGVAAGLGYNTSIHAEHGMLGRFDVWDWGHGYLVFRDTRSASYNGPDGESASCADQTYIVISFGSCSGFVLRGGVGMWTFSALHRVCNCATDEVWIVYVDTPPPAIPP